MTANGPQDFIEFPEALVQFLLYVGYVIIMANNRKLKEWFNAKFVKEPLKKPEEKTGADVEMARMSENPMQEKANTSNASDAADAPRDSKDGDDSGVRVQGYFNASIYKLMTQKTSMNSTLAAFAVAKIKGTMRETFDELDEEKNGKIEIKM